MELKKGLKKSFNFYMYEEELKRYETLKAKGYGLRYIWLKGLEATEKESNNQ